MDDVIGSAPDPQRRSRPVRLPAVPGSRSPRGRRVLTGIAILALVVTGVTVGRAGLDSGASPAGTPPPTSRPVLGTLLWLAAGQDTLYALVEDCRPRVPCRIALLASGSDGRVWRELPVPGGPVDAEAVSSWVPQVSGVEDQLSIEDARAGVVHAGTTSFTTRPLVDGPPRERVPANRESLVRLCTAPRCATPTVEFLEARTGERSPLATQPPFPPALVAVEGSQLWVAGIDPATRRYAVAVSTDDGARWRAVPLPDVATGTGDQVLLPTLVPVPEQDLAYLVLGSPGQDGAVTLFDLWSVPDPRTRDEPRRIRPEGGPLPLAAAVGLRDGRLALAGDAPAVVAPDGVIQRVTVDEPGRDLPPMPSWQLQRGPHALVVAEAAPVPETPETPADQVRLVVSATGDPNDWQLRPVTLPL